MGIKKLDTIFYDYWDVVCTDLNSIDEKFNIDKIFDQCKNQKKILYGDNILKVVKMYLKNQL